MRTLAKHSATRAGWRRITTKISTLSPGCCRADLHQHFYNVYAYCRWSDDLGDEVADPTRALQLLDAWEDELRLCYSRWRGPAHPVFIALRETIRAKDIPIEPFCDLLRAFRQDQTVHRYATWDEVLDYCVYSANPVGRLVLYLCGYRDEPRQKLSDFTCTALQLANFWQDVSRDLKKGRIYIPLEALAAHRLTEADIVSKRFDARYAALMASLIARTRELFHAGRPLSQTVQPFLRVDLEMFSRGGLAILDAIEASGYNTLEHRPSLSKWTQAKLLGTTLARTAFSRTGNSQPATAVGDSESDTVTEENIGAIPRARSRRHQTPPIFQLRPRILLRVQSHRASRAQQLLSRIFRLAQGKTQCALRALRFHAAD